MARLFNIARVTTATTGTGTITLGSAVSGYLSFADAGVADTNVVSYTIFEGSNRETGRGTYGSAGPTLTRDTVLNSTAGGTTKINLAGAAEVMITALKEDIANLNESQTFTADQTVQSADAGASVGPNLTLDRNSASPAASDVLGALAFSGRDSGGGTDTYARVQAEITDATAASEDGILSFLTAVAGSLATRFKVGAGMFSLNVTGGDKGVDTINVSDFYHKGLLTTPILQVVNTQTGAVATGTTQLPDDDTIPQNTEGDQYMTLAITPKSSTSKLKIEIVCHLGASVAAVISAALFQDTTANALAAMETLANANNSPMIICFTHYMTSGTTSSTTFKVRAGLDRAGTTTFNGVASGRIFGGVSASSITITEIAA